MASKTSTSSSSTSTADLIPDNFALLVEGSWKELSFKRVEAQDYPRVVRHIQEFFMRDEPTCGLLGYTNDFGDEMEAMVRKMLAENLSFLVEHAETSEVAGVRIIFRATPTNYFEYINVESYAGKVFLRLVDIMKKMSNLFDTYGVNEVAELFIASCAPDFRQQGLATEMYRRSLEFLRAEGFKVAEAMFTSPYTRRTAEKLGFVEICRLDYKEFIDDIGHFVFNRDELTDENFAAVMVKVL